MERKLTKVVSQQLAPMSRTLAMHSVSQNAISATLSRLEEHIIGGKRPSADDDAGAHESLPTQLPILIVLTQK